MFLHEARHILAAAAILAAGTLLWHRPRPTREELPGKTDFSFSFSILPERAAWTGVTAHRKPSRDLDPEQVRVGAIDLAVPQLNNGAA